MENRVFNFSAGPSMLPLEVLEQAQRELVCFPSAGMSVMEMSHRSKVFESILEKAKSDLKELMNIPDNYKILFLQGGGSTQFAMIPLNLMNKNNKADYVITGQWAKKAAEEAKRYGKVNIVASSADSTFDHIPELDKTKFDPEADYFYITLNNTIYGTRWTELPDTGDVPLVGDMSSSILSEEIDVSKFGLLFAGAQKNLGPAGVVIVIAKKSFLETANEDLPTMLKYSTFTENDSLYNTPPVFCIYMVNKTLHWIKRQGGVDVVAANNAAKAQVIYDVIDNSNGFFIGHADKEYRSKMNITFNLADKDLEKDFVAKAKAAGFIGVGGHRLVGGCRASTYNAVPMEACQALAEFMKQYQEEHK